MAGKYYDELEVGALYLHSVRRTITEADNVFYCAITMNTQPLHLDAEYARGTEFGQRLVHGLLTASLAVGISVAEITEGTLIANLGYEEIRHPHPMFHGDTLAVETVIVDKRESRSRPDAGIVRLKHIGRNQHGAVVLEVTRTALMRKKPEASTP